MSSAVQPSSTPAPSLKHAQLVATYPLDMFKAIEPFMPLLSPPPTEEIDLTNSVSINREIFKIYLALSSARAELQSTLPNNMLKAGGDHVFFQSTRQRQQGDWIKRVFELVRDLEKRIRDYFRVPTEPASLLRDIISNEDPSVPSLRKLREEHQKFDLMTGEIAPTEMA